MADADSFDFIHVGAGVRGHVPSEPCLLARDVSNDPYWCTLSGYSHLDNGAVTDGQIRESEAMLYDLYYRVSGMRCNYVRVFSNGNVTDESDVSFVGSSNEGQAQPYMRGCGGDTSVAIINNVAAVIRGVDIRPVRLYNGDVSDEGNFIGYGVTNPDLENTVTEAAFFINDIFNESGVYLNSFFDSVVHRFSDLAEHAVVNVDGFYMICRARINDDTFTQQSNEVVDAANLMVSTDISNSGLNSSISMEISGLDLYDLV